MAEVLEFNDMFYTNFEPKMKNRFIMAIDGIQSYLIKAANRPSIQFEKVTLDHINVKRQLKGKGEWQDIEITLFDPIVPSGAQQVMEWVRLSHESITGRDGYADFYKKDVDIFMLGPVGDKIENWPRSSCNWQVHCTARSTMVSHGSSHNMASRCFTSCC